MENLFCIATSPQPFEKISHNHNNNQTNPKPQPNTKNKPQKTVTREIVHAKHPQQQPKKKHRKHDQLTQNKITTISCKSKYFSSISQRKQKLG
jgi:hypothetical protein